MGVPDALERRPRAIDGILKAAAAIRDERTQGASLRSPITIIGARAPSDSPWTLRSAHRALKRDDIIHGHILR
jgi:hypothetical protein